MRVGETPPLAVRGKHFHAARKHIGGFRKRCSGLQQPRLNSLIQGRLFKHIELIAVDAVDWKFRSDLQIALPSSTFLSGEPKEQVDDDSGLPIRGNLFESADDAFRRIDALHLFANLRVKALYAERKPVDASLERRFEHFVRHVMDSSFDSNFAVIGEGKIFFCSDEQLF